MLMRNDVQNIRCCEQYLMVQSLFLSQNKSKKWLSDTKNEFHSMNPENDVVLIVLLVFPNNLLLIASTSCCLHTSLNFTAKHSNNCKSATEQTI